jgi:adenosylhomocysteine nucleosidase
VGDVMIGIIVAEEKELNAVRQIMNNIEEINIYEKIFYKGLIENKDVVVVKSNVGKVNSARVCQMLIDKFNPSLVINVGTAGSVDNKLEIGDIVVANTLIQYDFDVTPFDRKLGEIENVGECIKVKDDLIQLFDGMDVTIGCISSGDKFIVDIDEKNNIRNIFNALCIEMEGASIAQVCYLDNVPFLVIRSITDKLDGSSKVDFEQFLELSSKKASNILKQILKKI